MWSRPWEKSVGDESEVMTASVATTSSVRSAAAISGRRRDYPRRQQRREVGTCPGEFPRMPVLNLWPATADIDRGEMAVAFRNNQRLCSDLKCPVKQVSLNTSVLARKVP